MMCFLAQPQLRYSSRPFLQSARPLWGPSVAVHLLQVCHAPAVCSILHGCLLFWWYQELGKAIACVAGTAA